MADTPAGEERCTACDLVWRILAIGAGIIVGIIAVDTFTEGAVTTWLSRTVRPALASVTPLREAADGEQDAS